MEEELVCPSSGMPCPRTECNIANNPLVRAVPSIASKTGNRENWGRVIGALRREIESQGNHLTVNLFPYFNGKFFAICPEEVVDGELGKRVGERKAAEGIAGIIRQSVQNVITDLKQANDWRRHR